MGVNPAVQDMFDRIIDCCVPRDAPWREIDADTPEGRLACILEEINGAILPRNLQFRLGKTECSLTVNCGRITRFELPGFEIADEDDREFKLQKIAAALRSFTETEGGLSVAALPVSDEAGIGDLGQLHAELEKYCEEQNWLGKDTENDQTSAETDAPMPWGQALDTCTVAWGKFGSDGEFEVKKGEAELLSSMDKAKLLKEELEKWRHSQEVELDGDFWIVVRDPNDANANLVGINPSDEDYELQVIEAKSFELLSRAFVATLQSGEKE